MSRLYLIADTRERMVHDSIDTVFGEAGVPVVTSQINTGDYNIMRQTAGESRPEILACIERKTLPDLAQSMRDGRLGNRQKMLDMRDRTGCQLFYFVEGPAFPKPTRKFSRVPYSSLQSTLTSLMVRDGIPVVQTPNEFGTAQRLLDFVKSYGRNPIIHRCVPGAGRPAPATAAGGTAGAPPGGSAMPVGLDLVVPEELKGLVQKSDKVLALEMWSRLAGVSLATAGVLVGKFSVADLACARVAAGVIAGLRAATGRLVVKKARDSLARLSRGEAAAEIKILSGVPGVSAQMAESVLRGTSLRLILSGDAARLAATRIAQRNREVGLGKNRAEKIWRMLQFSEREGAKAAVAGAATETTATTTTTASAATTTTTASAATTTTTGAAATTTTPPPILELGDLELGSLDFLAS